MAQSMFESMSALFGNAAETEQIGRGYAQKDAGTPVWNGTPANTRSAAPVASPQSAGEDEPSEREDLLDQHVAYYLKHHPDVHTRHKIVRVRPGVYNFDGREISVEWHYAEHPGEQGYLICIDGPLRQPFADYVQENENGIEYDDKRLGKSALQQIPKGKRLSFGDSGKVYSRLEAMKVAKEQALVRERASEFVNQGIEVPQHELMTKYNKTLSQKLGERRQRAPKPEAPPGAMPQAPGPSPVPVSLPSAPPAAPAPAPAATPDSSPTASPAAGSDKAPRTHGAPKYCANHDRTEKRKKTKPHNEPCVQCGSVIQTNYVEFKLCPACSERDHKCMCCGAPAVGVAASPKAGQAPSSPMDARSSPNARAQSKAASPTKPVSPMNLFGMPDLFGAPGHAQTPQPAFQQMAAPQQHMYASQNAYASFAPNPVASQNMMVGRQF